MSTTMIKPLLIAALVSLALPTAAHAEFMAKPKSDVRPLAPKLAVEPLTVDGMLAKIQSSYMSRMRRCYNKGLTANPTLAGKVTVMFTVSPYGRVRGAATGIAPKVDACLTSAIADWRFPTTTARKEATFRLSLSLTQ
jgi:hypothetical protein